MVKLDRVMERLTASIAYRDSSQGAPVKSTATLLKILGQWHPQFVSDKG